MRGRSFASRLYARTIPITVKTRTITVPTTEAIQPMNGTIATIPQAKPKTVRTSAQIS